MATLTTKDLMMNTLTTLLILTGGVLGEGPASSPGPPQAPPVQAPPVVRDAPIALPSTPAAGLRSSPAGLQSATNPPPVITYAQARELAPSFGEIVVLIGSVKVPPFEHFYGAEVYRIREGTWPPSVEPGIYHVSRIGGVPHWWRSDWPRYVPTPVRGVPAGEVRPVAAPFRGPAFDPDHRCDNCGAAQYVIGGPGPVPGTHTHRCGRCGNTWFH